MRLLPAPVYRPMRYFMHISDQKLVRIQVVINRDGVRFFSPVIAIIAQLGGSFFYNLEMKRVLLPKRNAVVQSSNGYPFCQQSFKIVTRQWLMVISDWLCQRYQGLLPKGMPVALEHPFGKSIFSFPEAMFSLPASVFTLPAPCLWQKSWFPNPWFPDYWLLLPKD